jgi:demethylmenaquinone methyltransferase/2-methoxy-6-polyprenyl-1,4-benzoquinol methylase
VLKICKSPTSPVPQSPNPEEVKKLFDRLALRYDLFNRVVSVGLDVCWRAELIKSVYGVLKPPGVILDLGTGTGDVLVDCSTYEKQKRLPHSKKLGIDLSYSMLGVAENKLQSVPSLLLQASADRLPISSESVDVVFNAFVLRNIKKIVYNSLLEIFRVLKPGGHLIILEMYVPRNSLVSFLHGIYLRTVLPLIGSLIFGKDWSGQYLPETIRKLGCPQDTDQLIESAGFRVLDYKKLSFGICVLHHAVKLK